MGCEIPLIKSTHEVARVCMYSLFNVEGVYVFKFFSETTGPTKAKFYMEPQWDSNDSGHLFLILIPPGRGF